MKFGLFIEEIWAKIAVGTLIYRWKSILAVGSPYYHWNYIYVVGSTQTWSGPSDHVAWRRGNIVKKSTIYLRYITDILPPETIFSKNRRYISPSRYIVDILAIFLWKYLISDFSPRNIVLTPPDTWYIADISQHFPPWF